MTRCPFELLRQCPRAAAVAALIAIAGCQARDAAPEAAFSAAQKQVISDAVHNDGTPGFYFLPPMVPWQRGVFGPFRPDVMPTVQIDQVVLSPDGCTSDCVATVVEPDVAHWTRFGGSDSRRIRVFRAFWWLDWGDDDDDTDCDDGVPEGYFVVRWDSDDFGVALHGIYRVRVLVPSNGGLLELGYDDIEIVANRKEFRRVDSTEFTPLIDGRTLKIKFRIDTPALACVNVSCPPGSDGSPGLCDPDTGQCTTSAPPPGTACTDDGNPCTTDVINSAGVCVHEPGNAGTQCRAAAGDCDQPAVCDGVNSDCPANGYKGADTVCRASAGVCDAAETCTGSSAFCPADSKLPAATVCRAASGDCESPASCDGAGNDCPANELKAAGVVCRASAGLCDAAETCTGSSPACPDDAKVAAGTQCRPAEGDCDLPASCDGSTDGCPANALQPSTVVCRASAGACDVEERCTGGSAFCPADMKVAAGTVCRPSASQCDVAEMCDGTTNACPSDVFVPDNTACANPVCGNGPFQCRAGSCVPSTAQCPPGFNDGGDGVCLPSGPTVCATDDFDGSALDPHWQSQVGSPPAYVVAGSNLLISDASLASTPSFGGSWIFDANTDLGNQLAWAQSIGVNDFDVKFSFAWNWQQGQAMLAGVGLTNAANQLELRAGITAPADVPFPMAILRSGDGPTGDILETGTAEIHLNRAGGVLTVEFSGTPVYCAPFSGDIRNVVIFTVKGEFVNIVYPFGEFDLDSLRVCHPTLSCAPGFSDAGNGRCERTP